MKRKIKQQQNQRRRQQRNNWDMLKTKAKRSEDDEQFDVIHVKRGEVVKGGLTKVKVYEIE